MDRIMETSPVSAVRAAMGRLGWGVRELYVASFAYGTVGDEHDLGLHVASGDHSALLNEPSSRPR